MPRPPASRRAALYGGGDPDESPPGLGARMLELGEELRGEGVRRRHERAARRLRRPARGAVDASPSTSRESLAATLAKSQEDRRIFDLVFDRFFFRAAEMAAVREGVDRGRRDGRRPGAELNLETLRQQIAQALRDGAGGADARPRAAGHRRLRAPGRGLGRHRRRRPAHPPRARACAPSPSPTCRPTTRARDGLPRDAIRRFEALLRQELERRQIERTEALPPARPLNELDRALPSGPLQDLAAVHRVVAQLKRRLKTQGHELRGRKRHAQVDVRKTMRASLETGGVPVVLQATSRSARGGRRSTCCATSRRQRHERQRVLPLGPARAARLVSQDALVRLHRAHQRGDRRLRARAQLQGRQRGDRPRRRRRRHLGLHRLRPRVERVRARSSRTTCTRARPSSSSATRAPTAATRAPTSSPRSPHKAGRTFWLNPEPRLYWNYGDSVIAAYERHCEAFECWTTGQLEDFVKALTRPVSGR